MPGRTTGDNKFAITSYIVGTTLGDGCNYTSIQGAINDIQAAGGIGTIYLRPGTYTENLSFASVGAPLHIDIVGAATDGRLPSPLGSVNLIGNHTLGGNNLTVAFFQDIAMDGGVADGFTINPTAGQAILALQECSLNTTARGAVLNASGGAIAQFSTQDSQISTNLACVENLSDTAIITSIRGSFASTTASAFILGATCSAIVDGSQVNAADNGFEVGAFANLLITNAIVNSTNACYAMPLIGGSCSAYGCIHSSNDPTGYFITGDSTFTYCNITQTGTAIGIDPLMTQIVNDWKPYAIEGPAPGTNQSRGTALFNEDHFDVVDGFVSVNAAGLPYYSLTPYIVGPDVHSEFSTIQAAINQAVADGASGINQKNVHVKPTPLSYVENIVLADGVNIIGLPASTSYSNFAGGLEPLPVRLQGTVTLASGLSRICGLSIDSGLNNTLLIGDCTLIVNNCMINQASAPPYLMEFTGNAPQVLFEGTSAYAEANFLCTQLGTTVAINLEDSYLTGDTAVSQLTDNSSALIEMNYSKWYGAMTGGAGTSGAFRAHYSQISDALGVALITAENASLIGTYCLFEAGATFLLDSTTVGNFEMYHSSFAPFAFSAAQANINQIIIDQCNVLQVPTAGSTEIFRPTPGNIYRGTYTQRFIVNIQTVDATPTPILTVPLLDPETVAVFGEVIGFDATFNGALSGPVNGSARRNGGGAILVADQSSPAQEGTLGIASFSVAVSGSDLVVNVVGVALTPVNWSADIKVLHLQTDT